MPSVIPEVLMIAVPISETPAQHVRNALMMLSLIEQMSTATWALNPQLSRAARRAEAAIVLLDHHGPPRFAAQHLRRAVEALLEAKVDWDVVTGVPAAVARLLTAWFAIDPNPEEK